MELKNQRIRFYFFVLTLSEQCVGSRIFSLTTYLIIDNATSADAGTYVVEMTSGSSNPITLQVNISVVVGMLYLHNIVCMHNKMYVLTHSYTHMHCTSDS